MDKAFKEVSSAANDNEDTSKFYFSYLLFFLTLAKNIINKSLHSEIKTKNIGGFDPVEQNKNNFYCLHISLQQKWKLPEDTNKLIKELQEFIGEPTEEFIKSLNDAAKGTTVTPKTPRGKGGSALFTFPSGPQNLATPTGTQEMQMSH